MIPNYNKLLMLVALCIDSHIGMIGHAYVTCHAKTRLMRF